MIYLLNKNNMKKLAYIATIACSMFLTTSCVDLTQEPQSFITDEDYIASMDLTGLQQAATGLYNDLWNGNYGFNCRLQRINVCADDITYRAAKANNELANYYRLSPNITPTLQISILLGHYFLPLSTTPIHLLIRRYYRKMQTKPRSLKKY